MSSFSPRPLLPPFLLYLACKIRPFLPPLAKDLSLGWFVQIAGRMQHDLKKKVGVFCLIPWFWRLEILVLLFDFLFLAASLTPCCDFRMF